MKKWTLMLIPHDRSSTRTLIVSSLHFWMPVAMLAILVFTAAFLFQRERALAGRYAEVHAQNMAARQRPAVSPEKLRELETLREAVEKLRDENEHLKSASEADRAAYREGMAAVTARLNELLEVESQVRSVTGLAPRSQATPAEPEIGNGKGGPPEGYGAVVLTRQDERFRAPYLIYGMSRPSADLLMEEMGLRARSMTELLGDVEVQRDRIERTPSLWPVARRAGRLTSGFGYRKDPFTRRIRHHDGVDISAPVGTRVVAAAKGTVVDAGYDGYYGYVVRVDHGNGLETWYAHLSECLVRKGDFVLRNDPIGKVGTTGRTTGPHLHYEVRENGKPVDAAQYLGG